MTDIIATSRNLEGHESPDPLREAIIAFFIEAEASGVEYSAEQVGESDAKALLDARPRLHTLAREFFDDVWPAGGEVDDWEPLTNLLAAVDAARRPA